MKKMLTLAVIAVALLGAGQAFASEVTNVELSYQDGSTVACINVEGAVRFTHQTEEAKYGKPFRVIVDILSATHKLGANNFTSLPDCPVQSIRTSQFAVTPEAIVRIVFDLKGEQVYRVDSDTKTVTLYFADESVKQFSKWSSAAVVAASRAPKAEKVAVKTEQPEPVKVASAPEKPVQKSAAELNKSIKNDRMASLEGQPKKVEKPAPVVAEKPAVVKPKPVAKATASSVSKSESFYGPFVDKSMLDSEEPAETKPAPVSKPQQVAKAPVEPAKAQAKPATVPAKPVSKPLAKVEQPKKAEPKGKPALKSVVEKPAAKTDTKTVAQVDADDKASQRSTSRFRRAPAQSKKIQGTLVAEFPKRLVIKYKATAHRDPFHTLLDESKTYNSPVERQAPNVEGLKLVGVIEAGAKDNRALFEDKEGYGYILKTGDKVQKGYVLRVESDRVYFQIFEYGWSRTVALHLES